MRKPIAVLLALLLGTCVLHLWDIFHWQYWYHPRDDDWEFLEHASWYATNLTPLNGQWWRLADLHDVDGFLSGGDAWFQGLLMHVTGAGYRGYKLAVVAQTVATVGVYTALAWKWYGERTALIVCALLGSSWLWVATDHHGYGSIMRGALCIGASMLAASYRLPTLAGIVAGLGWYVFYTGRLALPCALLVLWGNGMGKDKRLGKQPTATVVPGAVVAHPCFITTPTTTPLGTVQCSREAGHDGLHRHGTEALPRVTWR